MKLHASLLATAIVFLMQSNAWSCDQVLQAFPRDCRIQDQFRSLRSRLQQQNVDIEEIAEYRALRFIDRASWEKAKKSNLGPRWVYKKMPDTWDIWDSGARHVESNYKIDRLSLLDFSEIHKKLLTRGIQDSITDLKLPPGKIRSGNDDVNGSCYKKVCDQNGCHLDQNRLNMLSQLQQEEPQMQQLWEIRSRISFVDLVNSSLGTNVSRATTYAPLHLDTNVSGCDGFWVDYLESPKVKTHLNWWLVYTSENLNMLSQGSSPMSPIEFSADAQKWMVSIHPFSDGNGRFSRIMQDLIMDHFDLPKAPAGDLANDIMNTRMGYRLETYNKIEKMLGNLNVCADYYEGRSVSSISSSELKMMCSQVNQLYSMGAK